jgi:hypothetical protein
MDNIKNKIDCSNIPDLSIHEKLITILQELSHHNNELNYVANETTWTRSGSRAKVINGVAVFDGYQPIGKVSVETRHHTDELVYSVTSDNIKGGRHGRSHTKQSKHLKEVMKVVKEAFKPKTDDVVVFSIIDNLDSRATRLESWARDHCRSAVNSASLEVLAYLTSVHTGEAKSTELPPALQMKLGNRWLNHMDNYRIAQSVATQFTNNYGVGIRIEKDGTINVADLANKTLTTCKSTYDLPTNYQEKITMLKIVEEDQPIEHIGFRFSQSTQLNGVAINYEYFYLVGGETYTSC